MEITISDANRAVDKIVRTLHSGEGGGSMTISEVIKAGSLGHGTAVNGEYDLDLVIYSDTLEGSDIIENGFEYWLSILVNFLDRKLPGSLTERNRISRSLQFKFEDKIDVDMLVSPFYREPRTLYRFLQGIEPGQRPMFTVSASKWQVEFFKEKPNQVKEFIKRAKAWRNLMWKQEYSGKPKSYLISVLVLRAYEITYKITLGDTSTRRIAMHTTDEMKKIVRNHRVVDIYWEKYYKKTDYRDLFPVSAPRIVDPANPANNLYYSGIAGKDNRKARDYGDGGGSWEKFSQIIDSLDLTKTVEEMQQREH